MGFWDAPTPGKVPALEMTSEKMGEWKLWWKANESRIDERIREINPGYFTDATGTPTGLSSSKPTSLSNFTPQMATTASFKPASSSAGIRRDLPVIPLILVLALATGGLVFYITQNAEGNAYSIDDTGRMPITFHRWREIEHYRKRAKMKVLAQSVLLIVIIATGLSSKFCNGESPRILHFYSPMTKSNQDVDLDFLAKGNPEEVWRFFTNLYWKNHQRNPGTEDVLQQAGSAVAKNTGVEAMLEEKLKPSNDQFQLGQPDLLILGGVPAPWSARILGRFVMDAKPMYPQEAGSDSGTLGNNLAAMYALSWMGFWDAPTAGRDPGVEITGTKMEEWKTWWKINESRIDERIREINPGYFGDAKPASKANPSTKNATSLPQTAPTTALSPLSQSGATTPVKGNNFPVVSVVLALALAAGSLVFYLTRKR
jgi:hypothetical protein